MRDKFIRISGLAVVLIMVFSVVVGCVSETETVSEPVEDVEEEIAEVEENAEGADEVEVIKIGFLTPLTGTSAVLGKQVLLAANMITDLINEEHPESSMFLSDSAGLPNLNGAKIELVVADHKGDATVAVAEAKRLITEEGVVAITGEFTSALIKAVAVVTEQYEIPLLGAGTAVTLTDGSTPLNWFFRFGVNDSTHIKDTFDFIDVLNETQDAGIKTVAFLSEDSEFGANIVNQELYYADLAGYEVVENLTYPGSATNLTAEVLKLKEADPDVLLMASFVSDALLFMNTAQEQNYSPKLIIGQRGGFIQPDYLEAMGDQNNGICTTGSWSADIDSAVSKELVELYPAKYSDGVQLTDAHVKDVACLHFVAMAINQAGTTEAYAVRDALRDLDYDMSSLIVTWKGISIDEYGQNTLSNGVVAQWTDGAYRTVYPSDVAAVDAVYPMPAWDEK